MQQYGYNPYLGDLAQDDGDVSLIGPVILLLGLVGIGGALLYFKNRDKNYYDDYEEPAVTRLRNVIEDIEADNEDEAEADILD